MRNIILIVFIELPKPIRNGVEVDDPTHVYETAVTLADGTDIVVKLHPGDIN